MGKQRSSVLVNKEQGLWIRGRGRDRLEVIGFFHTHHRHLRFHRKKKPQVSLPFLWSLLLDSS